MFVVMDSCILLEQLLLNSEAGAATRFFLREKQATLVIPEIVAIEVRKNLVNRLKKAAGDIADRHDQLLAVFGELKEVVLPSPEQIESRFDEILSSVDVPFEQPEFTIEVARSSLLKVIDGAPPNERGQQFKDGVIWAHCVDLLSKGDVLFVTKDKAFFSGHDYKQGLAKNLATEARNAHPTHRLTLAANLNALLEAIRVPYSIEDARLVDAYEEAHQSAGDNLLDANGFARDGKPTVETELFATEASDHLYVTFKLNYTCVDSSGEGRPDAILEVSGYGTYNTTSRQFSALKRGGEKLAYTNSDGEKTTRNHVLAVGSMVLGHRSVHHKVRVPLQQDAAK